MKNIIFYFLLCLSQLLAAQQDGTIDLAFGNQGYAAADFGGGDEFGKSCAFDAQGRLVVASVEETINQKQMLTLRRFLPNGTLDATFGTGGMAKTAIELAVGTTIYYGPVMSALSTGKILVTYTSVNARLGVARFLSSGVLDATFGTSGKTEALTGLSPAPRTLLPLPDGKFFVGGSSFYQKTRFLVAKFTENGFLDITYSSSKGYDTLSFKGYPTTSTAIARQSTGKIVAAGFHLNANPFFWKNTLARFNANGGPDPTFGTSNGIVLPSVADTFEFCQSLAVLPDDKILLGGSCVRQGKSMPFLMRCAANGLPDLAFGTNGVRYYEGLTIEGFDLLTVLPNGSILAHTFDNQLLRLNANGTLDATYGQNGILKLRQHQRDYNGFGLGYPFPRDLALYADGSTAVATGVYNGFNFDGYVFRVAANGVLLGTFGNSGEARWAENWNERCFTVRASPDGRILAGGRGVSRFGKTTPVLSRYLPNGAPDPSFGLNGKALLSYRDTSAQSFTDLEWLPDGRILMLSTFFEKGSSYVHLARLKASGQRDSTFGTNGLVLETPNAETSIALEVGSDGMIWVLSRTISPLGNTFNRLSKFHPDGSKNTAWAQNGRLMLHDQYPFYDDVIIRQGKILLAATGDQMGLGSHVVARLNLDGSDDLSFGAGGQVEIPTTYPDAFVTKMAVTDGGYILALGGTLDAQLLGQPVLFRLKSDGSIDMGFGANGKAVFPLIDSLLFCYDLAVQPDGKIVVSGWRGTLNQPTTYGGFVLRLLPNGTPDASFGSNGSLLFYQQMGLCTALLPTSGIAVGGGYKSDLAVVRVNAQLTSATVEPTRVPFALRVSPNPISNSATLTVWLDNVFPLGEDLRFEWSDRTGKAVRTGQCISWIAPTERFPIELPAGLGVGTYCLSVWSRERLLASSEVVVMD